MSESESEIERRDEAVVCGWLILVSPTSLTCVSLLAWPLRKDDTHKSRNGQKKFCNFFLTLSGVGVVIPSNQSITYNFMF